MDTPKVLNVAGVPISATGFLPFVEAGNCPPEASAPAARLAVYAASVICTRRGLEVISIRYHHHEPGIRVYACTCGKAVEGGWEDQQQLRIPVTLEAAAVAAEWLGRDTKRRRR